MNPAFVVPGLVPEAGYGYTQMYIRGIGNNIYVGADPSCDVHRRCVASVQYIDDKSCQLVSVYCAEPATLASIGGMEAVANASYFSEQNLAIQKIDISS